jgi:hypothetical protein
VNTDNPKRWKMATTLKKIKDSNRVIDEAVRIPGRDARIAELAYYKAEQRGFAPGHEMDDWLLAEREVMLSEYSDCYSH